MKLMPFLALSVLLSGCVNRIAADRTYGDLSAEAIADKKECTQGDKAQRMKLQRGEDRCREMIAGDDNSVDGLVCQRMANDEIISIH
jgi:hypothetical protein